MTENTNIKTVTFSMDEDTRKKLEKIRLDMTGELGFRPHLGQVMRSLINKASETWT